jgi:hypothetical protein
MKYYRFNRDRSFAANFYKYTRSRKKLMYMLDTNRARLLDSSYFENQTWGALHKAWKGYVIAKNKYELDRLFYYAEVIQKLQRELGLPISSFPDLGLTPQEQNYDSSEVFDRTEENDIEQE